MLVELFFLQLAGEAVDVGHERALAMAGDDHALAFEVEVGALDGDDADRRSAASARIDGNSLPGSPVAGGDALPDLLHDLQIHGAGVGLGDVYAAVHTVYTVYTQFR